MAIDFTRYQPPGVYTEAVPGPQIAVRSSVPTAVGVFGLTRGYRLYRESLLINPDTGEIITQEVITLTGGATSGNFTLTFLSQTTANIAYNASATTVQNALQALSNIGTDNVTVVGSNGGPWTVTFAGDLAGTSQPAFTYSLSGLVGGTPVMTVVKTDTGTPAVNRTLAQQGIKTDTVTVVNPNTGAVYALGTDYVVQRITVGPDVTPGTRDDLYTIVRVIDGGHIQPGDTVTLSYRYTDPNYFSTYIFYDYDDVRDAYGDPWDAAGNLQSELTLACKFAFLNGAFQVVTCAVDPANPDNPTMGDYATALDKFRDEELIAVVVPATGQQPIQELVHEHVQQQSDNRFERVAIMGMDGTVNAVSTSVRQTNAEALTDQRCVLVSPATFQYRSSELNKEITLGGQYMAAALAGLSVSLNAAQPLTRKVITGFKDVTEFMQEGAKNLETQNGLMVVEKSRRQRIQVRHGVTTDPTDLLSREYSIIRQQDHMVFRIRDYLDNDGLIGSPIYDITLINVKASAESALQSLVRDQIIRSYSQLKVRQLLSNPDVIEVRYGWLPAFPLNYIVVRYAVNLTTGDITTNGGLGSTTSTDTTTTNPFDDGNTLSSV